MSRWAEMFQAFSRDADTVDTVDTVAAEGRQPSTVSHSVQCVMTPKEEKGEQAPAASKQLWVVPRTWAEGYAAICAMSPPNGFSPAKWQHIIGATGRFLDQWTDAAIACGWTDLDVFGCDPDRPAARFDTMGLALLLARAEVTSIDKLGADLVTNEGARLRFRRRPFPPGAVNLWQLASPR